MRSHFPVFAFLVLVVFGGSTLLGAQIANLHVPDSVIAGNSATIRTSGNGKATLYLVGPALARKADIHLGESVPVPADELKTAGAYQAILCSDVCGAAAFFVTPAKPASLRFLVHPSRVPVSASDAVSGVAIPVDSFRNLILAPLAVDFHLLAGKNEVFSRTVRTENAIAWFRASSGKLAGALQVEASIDDLTARRVVQQVASDPCNLRIHAQRVPAGMIVETDPVHDCAGNPVPDGTIVTFTATAPGGKTTVDSPVKQGVARAQVAAADGTVISVASGVVMGNELRIGVQR